MSSVHICPVCGGVGTVPPGFYDPFAPSTTDAMREQCRACGGRGVIIVPDSSIYPPSQPRVTIKWPLDEVTDWVMTCL